MSRSAPTIRQLQYFIAITEARSFRAAADRLQVSQPTLTAQVAALEEAIGLQLFERSRAGTRPTVMARELLPTARAALEALNGFAAHAETLARGPGGTYRLGATPTLGPYLLPQTLPSIHRRFAALKLHVRERAPRDLESGLIDGDFDLILTPLPIESGRLTVAPLFREPLLLVMSADHVLAARERIGRHDLAGESVLTIEEHHHLHQQVTTLCEEYDAHVLRDYEGTSLDAVRQMVVMGMGIAFLPALYVRSEIHQPPQSAHRGDRRRARPSHPRARLATYVVGARPVHGARARDSHLRRARAAGARGGDPVLTGASGDRPRRAQASRPRVARPLRYRISRRICIMPDTLTRKASVRTYGMPAM